MSGMINISIGSKLAETKSVKETKISSENDSKSSQDFFSVMFSQMKNGDKTQADANQNIEQTTVEDAPLVELADESPKKSLDDHLLTEVLEVISLLNNETPTTSFPKYSTKIEQYLNDEAIVQEFKDVKNIADLMKLSEKLNLGLEKLTISKMDFESIKSEFPNLEKNSFFEIPKAQEKDIKNTFLDTAKSEIKSSEIPLTAMEKPSQTSEKEPSILEKLITKNIKTESEPKQTLKDALNIKTESENKTTVQTTTPQTNAQTASDVSKEALHVKVEVEGKTTVETNVQNTKDISKETLHVKDEKAQISSEIEKDITIKTVDKEIKNTQNIKEVPKEAINVLKDEKDEKSTTESKEINDTKVFVADMDETVIKETPQTTKTNEVKIESDLAKKGFTEALLQGLKTVKTVQNTVTTEKSTLDTATSTESTLETTIETTTLKTDSKIISKQEVISKNVNTARETFSSFANDLKEKMENYKPPIMKVQMSLNPKGLGEVDVTVVNRGSNLHVSINSNSNTMALFTQNQAEFKNSLVNMGFTNLEMNFSDKREGAQEQSNQGSSKNYFDENGDEQIDEENASIELVIPQYI
jgi:hypothetical protein